MANAGLPIILMLNVFYHPQPLLAVRTLFWAGILTSAICFAMDPLLHAMLKVHWKLIVIFFVLVLCWRIPPNGQFFHGLEYEDSYVYTVAGRQILENVGPVANSTDFPYSINTCAVGSLESCQSWESFPEHFIGYSYVISLFSRMVGYTPDNGSIVNLFAACLGSILIFCMTLLATDNATMASAAALVFAITPVFAVYGLETSSEPASNLCISLIIWFYMRSIVAFKTSEGRFRKRMFWYAYTAALLFSMTVKREDILLAIGLPLMLPFVAEYRNTKPREKGGLMILMLFSTAFALILSLQMRLVQTTFGEATLLKAFPMTIEHLAIFVFGFVRSFFVVRWYGGAMAAVIAGTIVACRRKGLSLVPLFLFVAFLLLYCVHIRSYYQMQSGHIEPRAALRFSMNLMTPWAVLAGIGIGAVVTTMKRTHVYSTHKRMNIVIGCSLLVGVFGMSFGATIELRVRSVGDEQYVRISPACAALGFASKGGQESAYIITLEPLIIQMYADTAAKVIDLAAVDSTLLHSLIISGKTARFVFLEEKSHQTVADFTRYGEQTRYLRSLPERLLGGREGFTIIRVNRP